MPPIIQSTAFWVLFALATPIPYGPTAAEHDALARRVAEEFGQAMLARDLAKIMAKVEVPWCHDAREVIRDKEQVREQLRASFAKARDLSKAKLHVRKIATLAAFRDAKKEPPSRRFSLADVLGKDHRIALLEIEHEGQFQPLWLGIRLEGDKALVVGFVD
jgi:hypothetical protein